MHFYHLPYKDLQESQPKQNKMQYVYPQIMPQSNVHKTQFIIIHCVHYQAESSMGSKENQQATVVITFTNIRLLFSLDVVDLTRKFMMGM